MKESDRCSEIAELMGKFLTGELSADESDTLASWRAESKNNEQLWKRLTDPSYLQDRLRFWNNDTAKEVRWHQLMEEIADKEHSKRVFFRRTLRYAAILLPLIFMAAAGWYFLNTPAQKKSVAKTAGIVPAAAAPKDKTVRLILASGKSVDLKDGNMEESITETDGTKVRNNVNTLSYFPDSLKESAPMVYNTLITPRGGTYKVKLSDGTEVWLNAASSLRYPTKFNDKERKVFLSGEAYFEVSKDARHPFIVNAGTTDITVLGTHFNVSAYPEDPLQKTTLAEGLVKIGTTDQPGHGSDRLLQPGYEAAIMKEGNGIRIHKADVEAALAWKNGMFIFRNESLGSIMRKLVRAYDVDVKYADDVNTRFHYSGRIRIYDDIAGILHLIELTGKVKFTLNGKELNVESNKTNVMSK